MELFTADDELLGRPTRVVRLDEFRDDPRAAVAAVEAACLGGASLRVPLAAYEKVSKRDADEVYRAQWRDWPWEDHEARIPGRVAENVRDRPRDDDDEGCADDDDAPPPAAPATSSRRGAASQLPLKEADWEEICWLQDEIGASTIIAEFGDAFEKFGFPCWPHPGEDG